MLPERLRKEAMRVYFFTKMKPKYEELGFKCGLEIHQQLEGKKLFCNCKTLNLDSEADIRVQRKLRAVAGETGETDAAATFEMLKNKFFIYESNSEDTCLIEYDEEPPRSMNTDALETCLKVALLLNCKIVDEIQIMRKTVIDGSNVSGFQRTSLIATNGFVETSLGKVHIATVCLEEESAQKLEGNDDFTVYKLDRLGIPLIEIATSPEIKSPEHAKEVASHIGMILRSVENIKRGIGTIRQDVNISIDGAERTEVKGFQDLKSIPKVIEHEIERQIQLIKSGKKIEKEVRKAEADFTTSFLRPIPSAARMYPETDVLPARIDEKYLQKLKKELPKLLSERVDEFEKKYSIPKDLAKEAMENENFEKFARKYRKLEALQIANILIKIPKEIKSRFNTDSSALEEKDFEEVLSLLEHGKIAKEAVIEILAKRAKGESVDLSQYETLNEKHLEAEIKKIIDEKPGLNSSAYMGLAMAKFRGKTDGKKIMELVKKFSS